MKTNIMLAVALAGVSLCSAAGLAEAQDYPTRSIRMVVGFPPGGSNDIIARLVGEKLGVSWGQPVVIDNRTGAGAAIAAEFVARSPADGYTLFMGSGNAMAVNPVLYSKLSYDPLRDFIPVTMVVRCPLVVAVHPRVPVHSVLELIAFAKASSSGINFSSSNMLTRLAGEMFNQMTGAKINAVSYRGGGPSVNGVLTSDVPMTIVDGGSVLPQIKGGLLRGLAVTTAGRVQAVPGLPTVAESGVPQYDIGTWYGLFVPARTPQPVIVKLNTEARRILDAPEMREKIAAAMACDPVGNTSDEFISQIRDEIVRFTKAARAANLEPE